MTRDTTPQGPFDSTEQQPIRLVSVKLRKFANASGADRKRAYALHRKQQLTNAKPDLFRSEFESALRAAATGQTRAMVSYLGSLKPLTDDNLSGLVKLVRRLDKRPRGRPKVEKHSTDNTKRKAIPTDYRQFRVDFESAIHFAMLSGRTEPMAECIEACIGRHWAMEGERSKLAGWFALKNEMPRGRPRNLMRAPAKDPYIRKHEDAGHALRNAVIRTWQMLEEYRREHGRKRVPREHKEEAIRRAQEEAYRSFGVYPDDGQIRRLLEKGDRPHSMHSTHRK